MNMYVLINESSIALLKILSMSLTAWHSSGVMALVRRHGTRQVAWHSSGGMPLVRRHGTRQTGGTRQAAWHSLGGMALVRRHGTRQAAWHPSGGMAPVMEACHSLDMRHSIRQAACMIPVGRKTYK